jgi:hypothetical protein
LSNHHHRLDHVSTSTKYSQNKLERHRHAISLKYFVSIVTPKRQLLFAGGEEAEKKDASLADTSLLRWRQNQFILATLLQIHKRY